MAQQIKRWIPETEDKALAKAIEYHSMVQNIDRDKLARMCGRSRRTIDYVLALKRGLGRKAAFQLADKLGTSYADMIDLGEQLLENKDKQKHDENSLFSVAEREDLTPPVRRYREIEAIDNNILKEIKKWLTAMEAYTPGFTSWFRLEFQNRFPEFDSWKKRTKR